MSDHANPAGADRPTVLVLIKPALFRELFTPDAAAALHAMAEVTLMDNDTPWDSTRLARAIGAYDAVVTGWGSPRFTAEIFDAAKRLRVVAHSAGSVKPLQPDAILDHGISLTASAIALAPAVAEFALNLVFLGLRPVHRYDQGMRAGRWDGPAAFGPGQEIGDQRIGVVGASFVGRHFARLVQALGATVLVYDPYLSPDEASALNVQKVDLPELMANCPIVSVHAPTTPETHHLIGAAELRLLPDNAYIINTARSWVLDERALLTELQSGRIRAAIDVFDTEPLPLDSPFRSLDNVIITPHIAGATARARFRQGDTVVGELTRFFGGEPLRYEITRERLAILA